MTTLLYNFSPIVVSSDSDAFDSIGFLGSSALLTSDIGSELLCFRNEIGGFSLHESIWKDIFY